jgi:hypothetical protein
MINFDRFRMGRVVTTGMTIATAAAMVAILPACSPGENPPINISSPVSNPTASPTPSKVANSDTASPSSGAIASPTPIAKALAPVTPKTFPIATPNSSIDYGGKTNRENWIVTDPDPKGLNCRWSTAMPKDWVNPSAKFPRLNIQEWAVVRQFPQNTELKANNSPAGLITIADENGQPWLKVSLGENDQICLVRANSQFVKPK